MKKISIQIFLITIFCLYYSNDCYSQQYKSLFDDSLNWEICTKGGSNFNVQILEDTLIESKKYKILGNQFFHIGYIREELDSGMVYARRPGDLEEQPIFNYKLKIGDTVALLSSTCAPNYLIVKSTIDTLINNVKRRKISFEQWEEFPALFCENFYFQTNYIVEGLGSSLGVIPDYTFNNSDISHGIGEVHKGSNVIIDFGCPKIVGVEEVSTKKYKIYPTLIDQNIFYIEFAESEWYSIRIYNRNGQLIHKSIVEKDLIPNNTPFKVTISVVPKGLYYVMIDLLSGVNVNTSKIYIE